MLIGYIVVIEASYDRVCTREERIIFYTMCARIEHNHVVKKQLENIIKEEGWYLLPNLLKLLS